MVCLLVTVGILCICTPVKVQASERHLTGDTEVSTVINPAGTATTPEEVGQLNTANTVSITYNNGNGQINGALRILITLTLIALAPTIIIMMTSFTRIIIVLHFTRSALNTQTAPPNQILIGLALILTFFIMEPTITRINEEAIQPFEEGTIDQDEALEKGMAPLREFMYPQTQVKDVELFMDIAGQEWDGTLEDIPNSVLVPSFMISELRMAFWIGFMIYIPFIVIDMVVASTLMSMGIPGCWSGHQYFPDGDFHSGADTDLCTEDRCHLFVSGGYRSLDDEHDGGVHGAIVVKFQPVCT